MQGNTNSNGRKNEDLLKIDNEYLENIEYKSGEKQIALPTEGYDGYKAVELSFDMGSDAPEDRVIIQPSVVTSGTYTDDEGHEVAFNPLTHPYQYDEYKLFKVKKYPEDYVSDPEIGANIKFEAYQSKDDESIKANISEDDPHGYEAIDTLKLRRVGSWIDSNIIPSNILKGRTILGVTGTVDKRDRTTLPSRAAGTDWTTADGYPAKITLNQNVSGSTNPIKSTVIVKRDGAETTEAEIKANSKIYQATDPSGRIAGEFVYTEAKVDPVVVDIKNVTISPTNLRYGYRDGRFYIDPNDFSGYTGLGRVNFPALTVEMLQDLDKELSHREEGYFTPENIKRGVSLWGGLITGTFDRSFKEANGVVVEPKYNESTTKLVEDYNIVNPDTGEIITAYDGLKGFTVTAVNNQMIQSWDENLKAENIANGVTIFGIQGIGGGSSIIEGDDNLVLTPGKTFGQVSEENLPANLKKITIRGLLDIYDENVSTTQTVAEYIEPTLVAENIKEGATIFGVDGTFNGTDYTFYTDTITVNPSKQKQTINAYDSAYKVDGKTADGLTTLEFNPVTIDTVTDLFPTLSRDVIKKGVEIDPDFIGTYEPEIELQNKEITSSWQSDQTVTPDQGKDGLSRVLVKKLDTSTIANLSPKNIKKDVTIMDVTGIYEGKPQIWFDFEDKVNSYSDLSENVYGSGGWVAVTGYPLETNSWSLDTLLTINNIDLVVNKLSADLQSQFFNYNEVEVTDDIIEQSYIIFNNGKYYPNLAQTEDIPNQKRYWYPYTNNKDVDGLLVNVNTDDGQEHEFRLYVIYDSNNKNPTLPVLYSVPRLGELSLSDLPDGYDRFYEIDGTNLALNNIKKKWISIGEHTTYIPKTLSNKSLHWILPNRKEVLTKAELHNDKPVTVNISALDLDYGMPEEISSEIELVKDVCRNKNEWSTNDFSLIDSDHIFTPSSNSPSVWFNSADHANFDIIIKFMLTSADFGNYNTRYLFNINSSRVSVYNNDNNLELHGSIYNSSWTRSITFNTSPELNIWYWLKVSKTGNVWDYYLLRDENDSYSLNNLPNVEDWSHEGSMTHYTNISYKTMYIGSYSTSTSDSNYFLGKIDLKNCMISDESGTYLKFYKEMGYNNITNHNILPIQRNLAFITRDLNRYVLKTNKDEIWHYDNYDSNDYLMDFMTNGYVVLPTEFNTNSASSWEISMHFIAPETTNNENRHFARWRSGYSTTSDNYVNCVWLDTSNQIRMRMYGQNNSSTSLIMDKVVSGDYLLETGKAYYIKFGFTGSKYYLYLSDNKYYSNLLVNYSYNSSYKTSSNSGVNSRLVLVNYVETTNNNGSLRFLYLDEDTYVKLNTNYIWKHAPDEYIGNLMNYTDDGSEVTMPVYLVKLKDSDKYTYIFSPDDTFDMTEFDSSEYVGTVHIPYHHIFNWDPEDEEYDSARLLELDISDEDAILYTSTTIA